MGEFMIMLRNVIIFVTLAVPGYILVKGKILRPEQSGVLSKLLMYLALPFMMKFCKKYGVEENVSHRAGELIMETAFPYHPVSAAGELLCDADIEYIGRVCFFEKAGLFRQEMAALNHIYSDQQWWKLELDFLQNNQFFTAVCREKRSAGRLANIAKVKALLAAMVQE